MASTNDKKSRLGGLGQDPARSILGLNIAASRESLLLPHDTRYPEAIVLASA